MTAPVSARSKIIVIATNPRVVGFLHHLALTVPKIHAVRGQTCNYHNDGFNALLPTYSAIAAKGVAITGNQWDGAFPTIDEVILH